MSIRSQEGMPEIAAPIYLLKNSLKPTSGCVSIVAKSIVTIIRNIADQETFSDIAFLKSKRGSSSTRIKHKSMQPKRGGNAVPHVEITVNVGNADARILGIVQRINVKIKIPTVSFFLSDIGCISRKSLSVSTFVSFETSGFKMNRNAAIVAATIRIPRIPPNRKVFSTEGLATPPTWFAIVNGTMTQGVHCTIPCAIWTQTSRPIIIILGKLSSFL